MCCYISLGRWAGISFSLGRSGVRLVLGFIAIAIMAIDLDAELPKLISGAAQ